jgi:hypothetical protein
LAVNDLDINLEKCVFAVPTLEILSHTISAVGTTHGQTHCCNRLLSPPSEYQAVAKISRHGVNFYSCVLPDCARVLRPLTNLLRGSPKTLE